MRSKKGGKGGRKVGLAGTPEKAHAWREAFLKALRKRHTVSEACAKTGANRSTVYRLRESDPDFRAEWDAAVGETVELLEKKLFERAVDGWDEPVFHQGVRCGVVRKFSPTLMIFALKCWNPRRYNIAPGDLDGAGTAAKDGAAKLAEGLREVLSRADGSVPEARGDELREAA